MVVLFFLLNFLLAGGDVIILIVFSFFLIYFREVWFLGGICIRKIFNYDGIMWGLLILSFFLCILIVLSRLNYKIKYISIVEFGFLILFLLLGLMGCFSTDDFFLFFVRFEFTVIPIFLMIISWGYSVNRLQAGLYIFLYTMITSMPLLIFLVYVFMFSRIKYHYTRILGLLLIGGWWWILFFLVFIVKLPIYLLHLWLPKAHVEAPLAGSIILAGVLLKLGGYGIYRGIIVFYYMGFISVLFFIRVSLVGSVLVSIICLRQIDMKRLVAYSSIVHMGPVIVCLILYNNIALLGRYFIIISHGICSSGIFYVLNIVYGRLSRRRLIVLRGRINMVPIFSLW